MNRFCPIRPPRRYDPIPDDAARCGHCPRYIVAGMVIDHCGIHGWLCDECRKDTTR